jgi:hypothetical protein
MPVRFATADEDQRQVLEKYLAIEEIDLELQAALKMSAEGQDRQPDVVSANLECSAVLVATLTGTTHEMAEDVSKRWLQQGFWEFNEHKQKNRARQLLPIIKTAFKPFVLQDGSMPTVGMRCLVELPKGVAFKEPTITSQDLSELQYHGSFRKECTVEVSAHHRQSVRKRVLEDLTRSATPLSDVLGKNLGDDDWVAERLAEAFLNVEQAAYQIIVSSASFD